MATDAQPVARSEAGLAALCAALGAREVAWWSPAEEALARDAGAPPRPLVDACRDAIRAGRDPLGEAFCALRSPAERRAAGATYTPHRIVRAMIRWARAAGDPARVIDPGCGSGRFLLAAGRAFPRARLLGVELDPLAALMCRAALAAAGLSRRAEVRLADFRAAELPPARGATLFIGNPPYVRHHGIDARWKAWLHATARRRGLAASRLAGLHVHFFLAALEQARPGDLGIFVTAAEWLDVNYGRLVRELLLGPLGLERIDLVEPRACVFEDALATAAITAFRVGATTAAPRLRRVDSVGALDELAGGRAVPLPRLRAAARWSPLTGPRRRRAAADLVELGELCAVHRGQVTGANDVWIASPGAPALPPHLLVPAVTRARELFAAAPALVSLCDLRRVADLPADLGALDADDRRLVDRFLRWARSRGAHDRYVARHRSPWWAVRLRAPAPILATYMARRPPAFVRNAAGARHLNIAHGLYPREPLPAPCLDLLAAHLRATASVADGRTYAGGLTKFEPREMERLLVPTPEVLLQRAAERPAPAGACARAAASRSR